MKSILLIGLGLFGRHIAEKLNELGHEIMAVDKDEERIQNAMNIVTDAQIGDSTNCNFLSSLGIRNFDVCIITIGDDFQSSLETTSLLSELGAQKIIARAATDIHEKFLLKNGADEVIYPEKQLAEWTAIKFSSNHVFDYIKLNGDYSIFEVSVPEKWVGKSIGNLDIRKKFNINILALKKNDILTPNINIDTVLEENCNMLVLGSNSAIQKCFRI